jgi:hypothetical protein
VITFLEYCGAKLSSNQRKMASKSSPFRTNGDFRSDGGGITRITSIPKSRQHDGSLHPKVEKMREGSSTIEILTPADVSNICQMYGVSDLDESHPKQLSNTGIVIMFNPQTKGYCLKKNV